MKYSEKKVPGSLKECYSSDHVAESLWNWSGWLDVWGQRILVVLVFIGIVSTINDAIKVADIDEDLVFLSIIGSVLSWSLYVFLEYCAYSVLSLLISALAKIVQNTGITANVTLYKAAKEEGAIDETAPAFKEAATPKPSAYSAASIANAKPISSWKCRECGRENEGTARFCKDCGTYK